MIANRISGLLNCLPLIATEVILLTMVSVLVLCVKILKRLRHVFPR